MALGTLNKIVQKKPNSSSDLQLWFQGTVISILSLYAPIPPNPLPPKRTTLSSSWGFSSLGISLYLNYRCTDSQSYVVLFTFFNFICYIMLYGFIFNPPVSFQYDIVKLTHMDICSSERASAPSGITWHSCWCTPVSLVDGKAEDASHTGLCCFSSQGKLVTGCHRDGGICSLFYHM